MQLFDCASCSTEVVSDELEPRCSSCGAALLPSVSAKVRTSRNEIDRLPSGVWKFRAFLPRVEDAQVVTLGEGGTPMLPAKRLGDELGFPNLLIKDETRNPTGSFIDRGSTVLASLARSKGVGKISCMTTGNLGASLAAYSAKAGIETEVRILPNTDHGKLYQMIAYGARVEILSKLHHRIVRQPGTLSVSAANPFILAGEKSTGFEIIHDLGWEQPDAIIVPVGTGGHLTMIWRGIMQLHDAGLIERPTCKLIGVQLRAYAPIVRELGRRGQIGPEQKPLTELEESEPIFKRAAVKAMRESKGDGVEISAREAIQGTSLLARSEGIFAEPASASVTAAVKVVKDSGILERNDRVVCVITGSGLKDTKTIRTISRTPKHVISRERPMIRPVNMGVTKMRVLKALAHQPRFGYGIWKALSQERTISTASVYQHLSELEGIALVRRSGVIRARGRERVLYELTRKGVDFLKIAKSDEQLTIG